jgi:hypothetical protein
MAATWRPFTPNVLMAAISLVRRPTMTSMVLMMPTPPISSAPRPITTMKRPMMSPICAFWRSTSGVLRVRRASSRPISSLEISRMRCSEVPSGSTTETTLGCVGS